MEDNIENINKDTGNTEDMSNMHNAGNADNMVNAEKPAGYCWKCGNPLKGTAMFCTRCGARCTRGINESNIRNNVNNDSESINAAQADLNAAAAAPGTNASGMPVKPEKSSFSKGFLAGALTALGGVLIVGAVIAVCVFKIYNVGRTYKNTDPSAEESNVIFDRLDMDQVEDKLNVIQDIVEEQFLFDMDVQDAEDGIYKGYMDGLGDKYSEYYSARDFEQLSASMEGVFYGIGATVQMDPDTGAVSVVGVIEDSPAEKAGVKSGDIIYAVGDTLATDVDFDTLVYDLIRGEKGTNVTITFIRDGETMDITITRGEVSATTVYAELMDDDIGFIEVSQFTDETVPQFESAVDDMIEKGAKGLVIDLRNNGGGVLLGAVQMIDYLIPEGVKEHNGLIVYTADKNGEGERYYASDGHQVDIPIVLLVNENSASASEVFTGALMDYKWATVVGTQTFGKGIVQSLLPLSDGSAIKLTVEHYYTPDGTDLHGEGLTPDYVIELDEECETYTDEHDNQYAKAVEIINEQTEK